mmetsp:Transcript_51325/g.133345  ORF Transcript_51325/g.133345 Transcript_51325/m.133345 type:complete len:93 (-) Transcript_51325:4-282(-)
MQCSATARFHDAHSPQPRCSEAASELRKQPAVGVSTLCGTPTAQPLASDSTNAPQIPHHLMQITHDLAQQLQIAVQVGIEHRTVRKLKNISN